MAHDRPIEPNTGNANPDAAGTLPSTDFPGHEEVRGARTNNPAIFGNSGCQSSENIPKAEKQRSGSESPEWGDIKYNPEDEAGFESSTQTKIDYLAGRAPCGCMRAPRVST
ncbi:hypothetical protein TWF696_000223 [Orbilia brochopaga]|uniref:Uncharacterized protein n=1 Tax=Orbilia brochopaga TaxID=3140254 RepID=A0AAV9VBW1_9PEZI